MKKVLQQAQLIALAIGLTAGNSFAQTPPPPANPAPAPVLSSPQPAAETAAPVALPATTNTTVVEPAAPTPKAAPKATKKKASTKKAAPKKEAPAAETAKPAGPAVAATVKQDRVNVRGQASLNGEVITQLRKGETVSILEEVSVKTAKTKEPTVWARVAMPANVPVWVSSQFIDTNTKAVTSTKLNVRAGPGENFSVIGRLAKGDVVKEIRQVENWIEIETPPGTFGFVALDLLSKTETLAASKVEAPATPAPETKPETKTEPKPEPAKVETVKVEPPPATPVTTDPAASTNAPAKPADPAVAPLVLPAAPAEEVPVKRVVRREGIIRTTLSIQAPTPYCLEDRYDKRLINYLISNIEGVNLRHLKGSAVVVTGEEYMDPRWSRTPILKIDAIEVAP